MKQHQESSPALGISVRPLLESLALLMPVLVVVMIALVAAVPPTASAPPSLNVRESPVLAASASTPTATPATESLQPVPPSLVETPPSAPLASTTAQPSGPKSKITSAAIVPAPSAPPTATDAAPADGQPVQIVPTTDENDVRMKPVNDALIEAFMQNWAAPAGVPAGRAVRLEVVVMRDGSLKSYLLESPSGHSQLDMSVLRAAGLVKRLPLALPAEFSGDSHMVHMQFRPPVK
ncbi:MAG: TonB C-terminal domain-containing protein [Verrucomicrobiaceae bacterium]|nr:TonB C-terminal domain-containing protein [Verrucomicrobiaceae bacterium]